MAMDSVNHLIGGIPLPKMVKVRQHFDRQKLEDVPAAVREQLARAAIGETVKPGMKIAITSGSRGVDNVALVTREIVSFLKAKGAEPFVIPAMGSHGGATAEGQKAILTEYGVTEEKVGCPIVASMEVKQIGALEDGRPVLIDKHAAEADGIVLVGRIKPHTAFRARYESGLVKMMAIGLAKQAGAEVCHKDGILQLGPNVERFGLKILECANILFGVGLIENAFDKTARVAALTAREIPLQEPALLEEAKSRMARIYFDKVDVLVVDEIGKNISGEGMDPNIAGRWIVPNIQGGINATRLAILDMTDETMGNGTGLSMADVCTKRCVDKFIPDVTYPNSLTSTVTCLAGIPMYFESDRLTLQAAVKMTPAVPPEEITMIRIKNTLSLEEIEISESLLPQARENPHLEIVGEAAPLPFDSEGNLR